MRLLQGGRCGSFGEAIRLQAVRSGSEDSASGSGRALSTALRSPLVLTELHMQLLQNAVPRVKRPVRESNPNIRQVAELIRRGAPSTVGTE